MKINKYAAYISIDMNVTGMLIKLVHKIKFDGRSGKKQIEKTMCIF